MGKNGSGKTTLLRILTGHESISEGVIYMREKGTDCIMQSVNDTTEVLWQKKPLNIGFCAQENNLPRNMTLVDLIKLFSSF